MSAQNDRTSLSDDLSRFEKKVEDINKAFCEFFYWSYRKSFWSRSLKKNLLIFDNDYARVPAHLSRYPNDYKLPLYDSYFAVSNRKINYWGVLNKKRIILWIVSLILLIVMFSTPIHMPIGSNLLSLFPIIGIPIIFVVLLFFGRKGILNLRSKKFEKQFYNMSFFSHTDLGISEDYDTFWNTHIWKKMFKETRVLLIENYIRLISIQCALNAYSQRKSDDWIDIIDDFVRVQELEWEKDDIVKTITTIFEQQEQIGILKMKNVR